MTQCCKCWEPGTQYNYGDVVEFEGQCYKIVQPHRSQGDWAPPVTPALWGRCDRDAGCQQQQQPCHQQPQQPQQPQYSQQTQYQDDKQSEPAAEPSKQHWYDDESTKKKVEIGVGLGAGAALLAGGLFAYKKHEEHKEEGKARDWARNNWIDEARARTDALRRQGRQGPTVWVLTHGKSIPSGAIVTGQERGRNLYSSRTFHEGALVVGKASEEFHKGGLIGYGDDEIEVDEFEVLVGDMSHLRWVSTSGRLNVASLGYRPVEGGHEKNGTPVYIARAPHKEATQPGKVSEELDGAYITYGGKEKVIKEYQVLCYN
jgi:hypothetical protein